MNRETKSNIKAALSSLKTKRGRSFLTMLGVIIGVASVVTVVSVGQGIKSQVKGQISQLGYDTVTVRPGPAHGNDQDGISFLSGLHRSGTLNSDDLKTVRKAGGVKSAVPLSLVRGKVDDGKSNPVVLATTPKFPDIIHQKLAHGEFFKDDTGSQPNVAVIGNQVAHHLFHSSIPLGHSFHFLGQNFIVRGVFKEFDSSPLSPATDFNNAIFIPQHTAQLLTSHNLQMYEILAKVDTSATPAQAAAHIQHDLKKAHHGQQTYAALAQSENLAATNNILSLLTKLIAGVAAISLLVGGIGIMNVMLVTVAERTHEIGLRKAVGATNQQIMNQFLTEAALLSLAGGIIGIILSFIIDFLLQIFTSLPTLIDWQIIIVAAIVSLLVGIIFGSAPALKAARKDPITSLRNE
jgi:ABC-type antimicrobial peptide transport system permease subunit